MSGEDILLAGKADKDSATSHGVAGTVEVDFADAGGDIKELSGAALARYGGLQKKANAITANMPITEDSQEVEVY